MQNNSFEERLARIKAAREQDTNSQAQARPQLQRSALQPARSSLLKPVMVGLGGIVLSFGWALVPLIASTEFGQKILGRIQTATVETVETTFTQLADPAQDGPVQDGPRKLIAAAKPTRADRALARIPAGETHHLDLMGEEYSPDVVVGAAGEALDPQTVGFGGAPVGPETDFRFNHTLQNNGCHLQRVAPSAKLVNVLIAGSPRTAPLQFLNEPQAISGLTTQIRDQLALGQSPHDLEIDRGPVEAIDLYVTDTGAPLHLVLQTQARNVVWNLHIAPGVTIDHVAMIANGRSAVTGFFELGEIEAIDASRYIDAGSVFERSAESLPDCMPLPIRKPDESWGAWDGAVNGRSAHGRLVKSMTDAFYAYDRWYKKNLGASPETNLISVQSAAQVLVGPAPTVPPAEPHTAAETNNRDTLRGYAIFHDKVIYGSDGARELQLTAHFLQILGVAVNEDPMHLFDQILPIAQPAGAAPIARIAPQAEEVPLMLRALGIRPIDGDGVSDLRQITDMSAPNLSRRVRFGDKIAFTNLLRPEEAVPDAELRDLYTLLRLPKFLRHHCADIGAIAASCKVATLSIDKSIGDHVWATANLAYVPNDAIGAFEPVENGAFIPIRVPDSPPSAALAAPVGRKAYLERVARLCDAMRARHGTCVIHYVGFQPNDDRSHPIEETAEAAVSVYGVNDMSERSKLETEVATLWPSL